MRENCDCLESVLNLNLICVPRSLEGDSKSQMRVWVSASTYSFQWICVYTQQIIMLTIYFCCYAISVFFSHLQAILCFVIIFTLKGEHTYLCIHTVGSYFCWYQVFVVFPYCKILIAKAVEQEIEWVYACVCSGILFFLRSFYWIF